MIPADFIGVFFENQHEVLFIPNILLVCALLIISGYLLFVADKTIYSGQYIAYHIALRIGIAKAIANTPDLSRSGATIYSSFILGVDRTKARDFQFLW